MLFYSLTISFKLYNILPIINYKVAAGEAGNINLYFSRTQCSDQVTSVRRVNIISSFVGEINCRCIMKPISAGGGPDQVTSLAV